MMEITGNRCMAVVFAAVLSACNVLPTKPPVTL